MFSYNELKKSFENRKLIGKLNSKNVFAISKDLYDRYIEKNSKDSMTKEPNGLNKPIFTGFMTSSILISAGSVIGL